jgi:hypothetical protein
MESVRGNHQSTYELQIMPEWVAYVRLYFELPSTLLCVRRRLSKSLRGNWTMRIEKVCY